MSKEFNGKTYIITYNGELYNTSELRNELQSYGHKFKGRITSYNVCYTKLLRS